MRPQRNLFTGLFIVVFVLCLWSFSPDTFGLEGILPVFEPKDGMTTPEIVFSNESANPGDFVVMYVRGVEKSDLIKVELGFLERQPLFFPHGNGQAAFIPVPYRAEPGEYLVKLEIFGEGSLKGAGGKITIMEKQFPIQRLYVTEQQQAQRDETLWEQDRKFTTEARSNPIAKRLWEGSFLQPAQGRISTEFGLTRYINDVDSGRHSGLDIAAPKGTPVLAANSGVVSLARNLYVTGNTIIVDHGLGLFSSYAHLDQIQVEQGQTVVKGEQIGTVGSTGFSTGPHLHWSVLVGQTFVNPDLVTKQDPMNFVPESK